MTPAHGVTMNPEQVHLREITDANRDAVVALHVGPGQDRFVAGVAERTATQLRSGISCLRSWRRLPPISASMPDKPVTFPPG